MFSFPVWKPQLRVEVLFFDFTGDFDDVPSLKTRRHYFPPVLYVLDLM